MMSYSDSISTVQLSPFNEDQWNRIVTYSPIYVHWTDLIMITPKRTTKPTLGKRNLIHSIDVNSMKLDDEILMNEIHDIRRSTAMSTLQQKNSYHEAKFLEEDEEERGRRTTSPTEEYKRSPDFLLHTRESSKPPSNSIESSLSNQQSNTKRSILQPQPSTTGPLKAVTNINSSPKPQASLGVQPRQSTIPRKQALSTPLDQQIISPLLMSSSRRPVGSAHTGRRINPQYRLSQSQIPQTTATNITGGFYEQFSTDLSSSRKKCYPRSTNTSRSTIHMLKTKNDRARQQQHIELKTILVHPSQQGILGDIDSEETIPNSIEIMRRLGGPITAFESSLRYNYQRQLNQFRYNSTKP